MKSTGVIRKIDPLGRIVIPREIIKANDLKFTTETEYGSFMEIFIKNGDIVLRKYQPGCHCCNELDGVVEIEGLKLCKKCLNKFEKSMKLNG